MSTHYGLRCKDDQATSGTGLRNNPETIRYLATLAHEVKSLLDKDVENVLDINFSIGYYWCYDEEDGTVFQFLQKHATHQLEMYDEYGRGYPLFETQEKSPTIE